MVTDQKDIDPTAFSERNATGGQDQVEDGDAMDNLQDADTLADLDGEPDGDRQLTTESDAIDGGLNDSDLGADVAGLTPTGGSATLPDNDMAVLGPDVAPDGAGAQTSDRATGLTGLRG